MNNKNLKSKEMFTKIIDFMKRIFFMNSLKLLAEGPDILTEDKNLKVTKIDNLRDRVAISKDTERERLLLLREQWENGAIKQSEMSDEDIDAIVKIYNAETETIKQETEAIKQDIARILKNLKESV